MRKTTEYRIPKEHASTAFEMIKPIIEKYVDELRFENSVFSVIPKPPFGIKEFGISCYTQGLKDAKQALNSKENKR